MRINLNFSSLAYTCRTLKSATHSHLAAALTSLQKIDLAPRQYGKHAFELINNNFKYIAIWVGFGAFVFTVYCLVKHFNKNNLQQPIAKDVVRDNDFYQQQWKGLTLDQIIQEAGENLACLRKPLSDSFKQDLFQKTAHLTAVETLVRYPSLFKTSIFTKDSRLQDNSPTFRERLEKVVTSYTKLVDISDKFGAGFYSEEFSFFRTEFLQALTVIYIDRNVSNLLTKATKLETEKVVPNEIRQALAKARSEIVNYKSRATQLLVRLERKGDTPERLKKFEREPEVYVRQETTKFQQFMKPHVEEARAFLGRKPKAPKDPKKRADPAEKH